LLVQATVDSEALDVSFDFLLGNDWLAWKRFINSIFCVQLHGMCCQLTPNH